MFGYTATDAPTLVAAAFALAAFACGLTGWITGGVMALRASATYRRQNIGLTLIGLGSVGYLACMVGVRCSEQIADLILHAIH